MITFKGDRVIVETQEEQKALQKLNEDFEIKFVETEQPEDVYKRQMKIRDENMKAMKEFLEGVNKQPDINLNDIPEGRVYHVPEDLINKPNHYHKGGFDVYEIMQAKMTPEEYRGFCKGNVLKYLLREDQKGGVEDIKKLRFNADRLIENMEGEPYIPEHKKKKNHE